MVSKKYIKRARAEFEGYKKILAITDRMDHSIFEKNDEISRRWVTCNELNINAHRMLDGKIGECERGNFTAAHVLSRPLIENIIRQFHISILKPDLVKYAKFCKSYEIDKSTLSNKERNAICRLQRKFSFKKISEDLYTGDNLEAVMRGYRVYNKFIHPTPGTSYGRYDQFDMRGKDPVPKVGPLYELVLLNRLAEFQQYHITPLQANITLELNEHISILMHRNKKNLIPMLPNKKEIIEKLAVYDYLNENDIKELRGDQ